MIKHEVVIRQSTTALPYQTDCETLRKTRNFEQDYYSEHNKIDDSRKE
jgi:hypothetical protein